MPGNQPVGIYEHSRAQSTVDFPVGRHVSILPDYKETVPEKCLHSHGNHIIGLLIECFHNHIPLALLKCKHVCGLSVLTQFSMFFCICSHEKWLKSTTLCLTHVITLQIRHSTPSTPAPLYSFHIKLFFQMSSNTLLFGYYICMCQTRKCNCGLTPSSVDSISIRMPSCCHLWFWLGSSSEPFAA